MTLEKLRALLSTLADADDNELDQAVEQALALFDDTLESSNAKDRKAALAEIADAIDAINAERQVREAKRAEEAAAIQALVDRVHSPGEADESVVAEAIEEAESVEVAAATTVPPSVVDEAVTTEAEVQVPVAATTETPAPLASLGQASVRPSPKVAELTSANGQTIRTMGDVDRALHEAARRVVTTQVGLYVPVVRIPTTFSEDRTLHRDSSALNSRLIRQAVSPSAIVAAGGLCAPTEARYELAEMHSANRPVRDGIPSFGADRGGIRYNEPSTIDDYADGTAVWTEANDANPTDPATKPVATVICGEEVEVTVSAITRRLKIGNFISRYNGETAEHASNLILGAWARRAEGYLLDRIKSLSTATTVGQKLGASRDLLYAWGVAAVGIRSAFRMDPGSTVRLLAPWWVLPLMREDLMRSQHAYAGQYGAADAEINGYLAERNVVPIWYMDSPTTGTSQVFARQTAGGLFDFPDEVQWGMFPEGTFIHLDGGTLDVGIYRDSSLNDTNDAETFAESFENVAKVGLEAYWGTSPVCANGLSAAPEEVSDDICGGPFVPGS